MGFTIATYQLLGLPPLPNIYVSIHGAFSIIKNRPTPGSYCISYTVYYQAGPQNPCITHQDQWFNIDKLPRPADLYNTIYDNVKKTLDPQYKTDAQTLVFTDDDINEL